MKNAETVAKILDLRAQGISYQGISKFMSGTVSPSTVYRIVRDKQAELEERRRIFNDAVREEFGLSLKEKTERKRKILEKLGESIDALDFTRIPPEKLLKFYLDLVETIPETVGKCEPMSDMEENLLKVFG